MQYLDITYRDDFVIACGDIHGEFETLVFNIIQKKMRLLLLLEIVASDLINWRIMMNSIKGSYIES